MSPALKNVLQPINNKCIGIDIDYDTQPNQIKVS